MRASRRQRLAVGWILLGCWCGLLAPAGAQERPAQPAAESGREKLITMDFQDVDVAVLVKFISEITGRNFIVDEKVRGKVTIISPGKISVDEAYTVFQSVLQVKGFTTVPSGSIIKIVPTKEAKSSTLETILPNASPSLRDEYVTRLIPLRYVDASNMVAILQPLISPDGLLAAYGATNTLILIDTASQTDRMVNILKQLDVEGFEQGIEVVRLNYAFAGEIAALLQQVLEEPDQGAQAAPAIQPGAAPDARVRRGGSRAAAARPAQMAATVSGGATPERAFRIIPDERTNSLILLAGPLELRRIKDLIARLDVPLPLGTGRIHVYYLKYANAFETASVLSSLISGYGVGGIGMGLGLSGRSRGLRGGGAGYGGSGLSSGSRGYGGYGGMGGGYGGLGGYGGGGYGGYGGMGGMSSPYGQMGMMGSGSLGSRGGYGGAAGGMGGAGGQGAPGSRDSQFEGIVRITADPSTNALIINASPQDFETLKEVIAKLDVRRRQVYVESIIAEISVDKTRELGIELQGAISLGSGVGIGRTNLSGDINQTTAPQNLQGMILAALSNQTITVNGVTIPAQQAILRALEKDNDANILSAPTMLTTDNQEAEIVAGQNLPFIASRATSDVNLSNTFATIERRDVGITLRITPQISEGGSVRLDIFQEVSDVIGNDPQLGPTTTIRSATTTVVARDGQTVVIGGLIFDAAARSESKVPFLGDIPVLGNFFRFNNVRNRKTNLLVFLTPHIIRNERDQRNLSVAERERIVRKPFDERGERGPNWDVLNTPSWEIRPSMESGSEAGETTGADGRARTTRPEDQLASAKEPAYAASGADRYLLLASVHETGSPLPSLATSNGLLALVLPPGSSLSGFFRKGGTYRFQSDYYAADYVCLDVFSSPQEAFAQYPEGMQVSRNPVAYLNWHEPVETSTAKSSNWTAVP